MPFRKTEANHYGLLRAALGQAGLSFAPLDMRIAWAARPSPLTRLWCQPMWHSISCPGISQALSSKTGVSREKPNQPSYNIEQLDIQDDIAQPVSEMTSAVK